MLRCFRCFECHNKKENNHDIIEDYCMGTNTNNKIIDQQPAEKQNVHTNNNNFESFNSSNELTATRHTLPNIIHTQNNVKGLVVWITGATAGIGEACAWRFAETGSQLLLIGRRTERLDTLKHAIVQKYPDSPKPHCLSLNIMDIDHIKTLPNDLPDSVNAPDILVNNAGLALGMKPVWENNLDDVQTMLSTNVTGLIAMTTVVLPGMIQRCKGHIINIGSVAGHNAYAGGSIYCATKFAVDAYSTSARHDLVGTPIRISVVSPGMVNTEFSTIRFGNKNIADKVYEDIEVLVAADIADNVLYVATRPKNVQIGEIVVWPTNQAGVNVSARVGTSLGGLQHC